MPQYNSVDDIYAANEEPTFGLTPSEELRDHILEHKVCGNALDIACGDGRDTLFLASVGFQVTGLEISKVALEKLMKFAIMQSIDKRIDTICCDVRIWDFPINFFDVVTSATGLDHIPKEDLEDVMKKITMSLKPGGILFLEVHTVDDPGFGIVSGKVSDLSGLVLHYFERNELLWLVLNSEFEIIRYEEKAEEDRDHGEPHMHGFANVLARKK